MLWGIRQTQQAAACPAWVSLASVPEGEGAREARRSEATSLPGGARVLCQGSSSCFGSPRQCLSEAGPLPRRVGPGPAAGGPAAGDPASDKESKGLVLSGYKPSAPAARTPTGACARGFSFNFISFWLVGAFLHRCVGGFLTNFILREFLRTRSGGRAVVTDSTVGGLGNFHLCPLVLALQRERPPPARPLATLPGSRQAPGPRLHPAHPLLDTTLCLSLSPLSVSGPVGSPSL